MDISPQSSRSVLSLTDIDYSSLAREFQNIFTHPHTSKDIYDFLYKNIDIYKDEKTNSSITIDALLEGLHSSLDETDASTLARQSIQHYQEALGLLKKLPTKSDKPTETGSDPRSKELLEEVFTHMYEFFGNKSLIPIPKEDEYANYQRMFGQYRDLMQYAASLKDHMPFEDIRNSIYQKFTEYLINPQGIAQGQEQILVQKIQEIMAKFDEDETIADIQVQFGSYAEQCGMSYVDLLKYTQGYCKWHIEKCENVDLSRISSYQAKLDKVNQLKLESDMAEFRVALVSAATKSVRQYEIDKKNIEKSFQLMSDTYNIPRDVLRERILTEMKDKMQNNNGPFRTYEPAKNLFKAIIPRHTNMLSQFGYQVNKQIQGLFSYSAKLKRPSGDEDHSSKNHTTS
jgi:hypothetical protein